MIIQCSLCCNSFDKDQHLPRILIACGHTLCEMCLRNILINQSEFQCPDCQVLTIVEQDLLETKEQIEQAMNHFPKNLALMNLHDFGHMTQKTQNTTNSGSSFSNNLSKNKNTKEMKSLEESSEIDDEYESSQTDNQHQRPSQLQNNNFLHKQSVNLGNSVFSNGPASYSCPQHNKKIKAYCASDKSLLCIDCIVLSDVHKSHEIIAPQKGYEQEAQVFAQHTEQAKELKDRLQNINQSIETQMSELNQTANEQRQQISTIYNQLRKLLQERETELKKNIARQLEEEEIRLKTLSKSIKQQLKMIEKFQEEMHLSQFETETDYLSKIKKRQAKKDKALKEIQHFEFQKVFNEFIDKDELKKISQLITSKSFFKLNNSVVNQNQNVPITSSNNHNQSISNSKSQQNTNRKSQRPATHNLYNNGGTTKINRINLITSNSNSASTQQQNSGNVQLNANVVTCPLISVAQIRSRSKDKSEALFKSSIMAKKQNQIANAPSPFTFQNNQINTSINMQPSSKHFQSLEFSPQQQNLNDLDKLHDNMFQKTISINEKFQQQTFSDTSTDREYYMSHPKNLLLSQDSNSDKNNNYNHISISNQNPSNTIPIPNQSITNQINIYSSISMNNHHNNSTSQSQQHQMFSKHYSNFSKRNSKLTTTASNNDSGKKPQNNKTKQLISTTINLKDIAETTRVNQEKSINSLRESYNPYRIHQAAKVIFDQKRVNSSSKNQHTQSSMKKKIKQRKETQDYSRQQTRHAEIRLQDENLKNPNILCNQFYNEPDENQNNLDADDEEIDQIFDEDEFNENKIQHYKIGLQKQNQSQIEYSLGKNHREPLFDLQQTSQNINKDGVDKQKPYNERKKAKRYNEHNKGLIQGQRNALIVKTQTEVKHQDLGYFENNPTPKQLDFDKWQKCKVIKSPLDNSQSETSEMITDSMIQNNNYQHHQGQNKFDQLDLLKQLYQKTESYLYVVSGFYDQPLNSIEKYDPIKGTWTEITGALNIPRTKFQCLPVQQNEETLIYILGGKKSDGNRTNSIEVFNPRSGGVKQIGITLQKPRSGFASVCVSNQLLLIGGNDGKVLNKVDALDLQNHTWAKLPNMIMPRDELAVAMGPDLKIYAVGGYGGPDNSCLNTAERFDPHTGRWEMLPALNECRRALSLVALPDGIYAIGGYNGQRYLSSVEKFDEQRNQWVLVNSMNNERCTLSAIPSPDYQYIYVLGGFNGKPMNVVERYSVLNDVWEFVTPMKRARFMHSSCFVSINNSLNAGNSVSNMIFDQEDF